MKSFIRLAVAHILAAIACTKSNSTLDQGFGCIEVITVPVTAHEVKETQVKLIDSLFKTNHIDNTNLRYVAYGCGRISPRDSTSPDMKMVVADQYINGVRLFTGSISFSFFDNKFRGCGGHYTAGTSILPIPKLPLPQIRILFLKSAGIFDRAIGKLNDSCLTAEFGYYDLSRSPTSGENLIKAWRVTVKNSSYSGEFPVGYYQDDGTLIEFEEGISSSGKCLWFF